MKYGGWVYRGDFPASVTPPSATLFSADRYLSLSGTGQLFDGTVDPSGSPSLVPSPTAFSTLLPFFANRTDPHTDGAAASGPVGAYLPGVDGNLYLYVEAQTYRTSTSGPPQTAVLPGVLYNVCPIPGGRVSWGGVVSLASQFPADPFKDFAGVISTYTGLVLKLTPSPTNLLSVSFDGVIVSPVLNEPIMVGVSAS